MNFYKDRIVFTGGSGKFGKVFRDFYPLPNIFFPSKNEFNILNIKKIESYLNRVKPKMLIHAAALSRPMKIHETSIDKSITTNIIGTSNIVLLCSKLKIKLIYFSTNYVYPFSKYPQKEIDAVLPINNYAWSKLGGESAVQMYKNSLILRIFMSEEPFIHKGAFSDVIANFAYHSQVATCIPKIINHKGILNIGGKVQSVYNFAKTTNKKVKKILAKKTLKKKYFKYQIIDIKKLKNLINKK
jgi:dTDP-4-dehydrorhamnose reductase